MNFEVARKEANRRQANDAGVQIEEPFAVLPLDDYCGVCERSVQNLLTERKGMLLSTSLGLQHMKDC